MTEILSTQLPLIAVGMSAIAGFIAVAVFFYNQRKQRELSALISRLQHDLKVANSSAIGMGQHLMALERRLQSSDHTDTGNSVVLSKAKKLLVQGGDVDTVAKQCGLSYAEVSLMSALHRQGKLDPKVRPISSVASTSESMVN